VGWEPVDREFIGPALILFAGGNQFAACDVPERRPLFPRQAVGRNMLKRQGDGLVGSFDQVSMVSPGTPNQVDPTVQPADRVAYGGRNVLLMHGHVPGPSASARRRTGRRD
jgi:hypothetical protein